MCWRICKCYGRIGRNSYMENMTSKDKEGRILVNGEFKICNIASNCNRSSCYELCIINQMIERLYELEHKERNK